MNRVIALFGIALFLTSCGAETITATYGLTMNVSDAHRREELALAAMRVVARRVAGMQVMLREQSIRQNADGSLFMDVTVDHPATIDLLSEQLAQPLDFAVRIATEQTTADSVTVAGHGSFRPTSITARDVAWVDADMTETEGMVQITLTPQGQRAYLQALQEAGTVSIGIFVRGALISILSNADAGGDTIVIRGIPTPAFAEIFADDVNVGTHVTFAAPPSPSVP